MNTFYRQGLINRIDKAIKDARLISPKLEHPYLIGKFKEILIDQLIKPMLVSKYSTGSGKITDAKNNVSSEVDVVVYSKELIPPVLFSENFGVYPSESVLSCIEVKSRIDDKELKKVFDKYKEIKEKIKYEAGEYDANDNPLNHSLYDLTRELFAFGSTRSIFDQYKNIDSNWNIEPMINNLCVVDVGCWSFCAKRWNYTPTNADHEEVVSYLSNLINTLSKVAESRKIPRIGQYLTDSKTSAQLT